MAHFAIVTPPLAGHVNALAALAVTLIERGHAVTLFGPIDVRERIPDPRIGFAALGKDSHPAGALARDERRMGRLLGLLRVPAMIRDLARLTDAVCRDAPGLIERLGVDALIVDQLEPGGAVAAETAGVPYATVATGLHVNREEDVPPPFVGWAYDPSERGRWKVRGAYRVSDRMMAPIGDVLAHHCRANGLPVHRDAADLLSPRADLLQAVPSIDYPRRTLSPATRYVGPLRRPDDRTLPELDALGRDRPLAFASLGTLQGAREGLLRRIASACDTLGLDLVLVHCGLLHPDRARRIEMRRGEGRTIVRDFVPQRAVLERADVAILHGGFNTILDALAARTPPVVLPLAFEQPAIAARIERAGVGRRLSPSFATERSLRAAIEGLLRDDDVAARVDVVAREIESAGGVELAADLVEGLLQTEQLGTRRVEVDA